MKTIIAISTALLLFAGAPIYAAGNPPVNKKHRHAVIFKKKKHKKPKAKKNESAKNDAQGGQIVQWT